MDKKDSEFFLVVHPLSATVALSTLSSRAKPKLARTKHLDPWLVGWIVQLSAHHYVKPNIFIGSKLQAVGLADMIR